MFLLQHAKIYDSKPQLTLLQKWTSLSFLLKKTFIPDNKSLIHSKLCSLSNGEWIQQVIGYAMIHIIPSQLGYYVSLLSGLQTFKQLTSTNMIISKVSIDGKTVKSKKPRIKAPTTAIKTIAHKLGIMHLDEEINVNGYQSVTSLIGELNGYYTFYETERFKLLKEKKTGKPVFHGQHKKHQAIETKPPYAQCLFNNQFAEPKVHSGSLGVEKTYSFIEQQEFNRGKKGIRNLYIQQTKMRVAHDMKQFQYWREREFENTDWSIAIIDDYTKAENDLFQLSYVEESIKSKGYYKIDNHEETILEYVKKQLQKDKLIFTSKPKWKNHYHLILFVYLMEKPNSWKLTQSNLPDVSKLFLRMFDDEFLVRRCEEWGFYLH